MEQRECQAEGSPVDHIRDMTERDLDAVLRIERRSFPSPWSENMFREELSSPVCCNRIALRGQALLGYICFAIVYDEVHLRSLAVDHEWRDRGVGGELLSDMFRLSIELGCRVATLEVRPTNADALGLYERFGFRIAGVRKAYYGDTGEDALIMWADMEYYRTGQVV